MLLHGDILLNVSLETRQYSCITLTLHAAVNIIWVRGKIPSRCPFQLQNVVRMNYGKVLIYLSYVSY